MNVNDLRRLSRKDLIEIIYAMKQRELELTTQLAEANRKLQDRDLKLSRVGNLAEASLALSGIFESAQNAADLYLEAIRRGEAPPAPPTPKAVILPDPERIPAPEAVATARELTKPPAPHRERKSLPERKPRPVSKNAPMDRELEDFLQKPIEVAPQETFTEKLGRTAAGLSQWLQDRTKNR